MRIRGLLRKQVAIWLAQSCRLQERSKTSLSFRSYPEICVTSQIDGGAGRQHRPNRGPWALDGGCTGIRDFVSSRETEIVPIGGPLNQGWVVDVAGTRAAAGVCISLD